MEMLDSVFGSCMRSIVWGAPDNNNKNKYIDYMPSKKWKYKDENLMHELSDRQSWDVMDLTNEDFHEDKTPQNIKLQLHDNVFLNPLNENNGDFSNNKREEEEEVHIIVHSNDQQSIPTTNEYTSNAISTTIESSSINLETDNFATTNLVTIESEVTSNETTASETIVSVATTNNFVTTNLETIESETTASQTKTNGTTVSEEIVVTLVDDDSNVNETSVNKNVNETSVNEILNFEHKNASVVTNSELLDNVGGENLTKESMHDNNTSNEIHNELVDLSIEEAHPIANVTTEEVTEGV